MRARASPGPALEIDMTPMIDVVFQLLIFFLVTLKMPRSEVMIETDLPTATGPGTIKTDVPTPDEEFEDIRLVIFKDRGTGAVQRYINDMMVRSDSQLYSQLTNMKKLYAKGRVIVICADNVPYKHVVRTITIVQASELPMAFGEYK